MNTKSSLRLKTKQDQLSPASRETAQEALVIFRARAVWVGLGAGPTPKNGLTLDIFQRTHKQDIVTDWMWGVSEWEKWFHIVVPFCLVGFLLKQLEGWHCHLLRWGLGEWRAGYLGRERLRSILNPGEAVLDYFFLSHIPPQHFPFLSVVYFYSMDTRESAWPLPQPHLWPGRTGHLVSHLSEEVYAMEKECP